MPVSKVLGAYVGAQRVTRAFRGERRVLGRGPWVGGTVVRRNLAINPFALTNFVSSTTGYVRIMTNRFAGTSTSYERLLNQTDGPIPSITSYARGTIGSVVGPGRGFHLVGNPESTAVTDSAPVTAGEPIHISVWARHSSAVALRLGLRFNDGVSTTALGNVNATGTATAGKWQRLTILTTPPVGATGFTAYVSSQANSPTGATIDITGLVFERNVTVAEEAFSGETPNDPGSTGYAYEWDWPNTLQSTMRTKTDYRVRDDFNRAESLDTGPLWSQSPGYKIASNQLTTTFSTTTLYYQPLAEDVMSPDMEVSFNLTRGTSGSVGIALRYVDTNNLIGVRLGNNNNLLLFKQEGTLTQYTGQDITNWVEGSRMRITLIGNNLRVYINDAPVLWALNMSMSAAIASSKRVALRTQGSTATTTPPIFDNFEAFSLA